MLSLSFIRKSKLLLRRHLGIAIPPRAQLQPPAYPAQTLAVVGGALAAAHYARGGLTHPLRRESATGLLKQRLRHHDLS
jgi:hypothetical protein